MLSRLAIRRGKVWRLERKIEELERDKNELITAIRLTQEYAMLPAVPGWSWYEALVKHDPQLLNAMLNPPHVMLDPADQVRAVTEGWPRNREKGWPREQRKDWAPTRDGPT